LKKGTYFILDRYSYSNVFQIAKGKKEERGELLKWLQDVESRLPQADIIIFLDVDPEITKRLLKKRKVKIKLGKRKKEDIHEMDINFQKKVRNIYKTIAKKLGWIIINCCKKGMMKSKEEIHNEVYKKLKDAKII